MGARGRAAVVAGLLIAAGLTGFVGPTSTAAPAPAGQCSDASLRVRVHDDPKASGAGQLLAHLDFQNRGSSACTLRGAPGVSLVGHGNGTQIGRPADRRTDGSAPTVHLAPGQTARAELGFTNIDEGGGPYDTACKAVRADGFRIYPPHSYRAVFVRDPQYACSNTRIHWGSVEYLDRTPIGCAATGGAIPAGATRKSIADVDGDALPDTEWITPTRMGIRTASGAVSSVRPDVVGGAGPRALSVVLQNTHRALTIIAGSKDAQVFRFANSTCSLRPVLNPRGHQYRLDLTNTYGDGASCTDPDGNGADQLTGVLLSRSLGSLRTGDTETIRSTVISIDGLHASNGRTRTSTATWPKDRATIERAATITCRGLTLQHDGISAR